MKLSTATYTTRPSGAHSPARAGRPRAVERERIAVRQCLLARYIDRDGRQREILSRPARAGSTLVLDRDLATGGDRRLLAHLAADEPGENATIVCRDYLRDSRPRELRCRALHVEDADADPLAGAGPSGAERRALEQAPAPCDRAGRS